MFIIIGILLVWMLLLPDIHVLCIIRYAYVGIMATIRVRYDVYMDYGIVFRAVCVFTGTSHLMKLITPVSPSNEGGIW